MEGTVTVFILRRLLLLIPMLLGVALTVFLILHLIPGDPARIAAGPDASEADIEQIRTNLGLDQPLPMQFGLYVTRLLEGDMGRSFQNLQPVTQGIARTIIPTLELTAAGMLFAVAFGVPLGIISALQRGRIVDRLVTSLSVLGISTPGFFLGLLLMLLFASTLGWLPPTGRGTPAHLVLPAITLGLPYVATFARFTRSSMLDTLAEDYVRTARAKGLSWPKVTYRHALRNASIPLVTIFGLDFGRLLGGAVIVETVFAWPGMGRYMIHAIAQRDIFVIQGTILVFAAAVVVVNLLVDIVYGILDPRITYS
jgi:ABC-type dipeptide/oligopeptide/nickel transport system permease component